MLKILFSKDLFLDWKIIQNKVFSFRLTLGLSSGFIIGGFSGRFCELSENSGGFFASSLINELYCTRTVLFNCLFSPMLN